MDDLLAVVQQSKLLAAERLQDLFDRVNGAELSILIVSGHDFFQDIYFGYNC